MSRIYQPLPIYTAEEYQLRNLQETLNARAFPTLVVSRTQLTPFIVKRVVSDTVESIAFSEIEAQNINDSNKTYDILDNLGFDYGEQVRGDEPLDGQKTFYSLYRGASAISALPQGIYQLYLKDDQNNEFYSETFRIWFPSQTVKFEYKNSSAINDLWFYNNFSYEIELESFMYSSNEYDELVNAVDDKYGHRKKTSQRKDEIMAVDVLSDYRIFEALQAMEMCDTIYFTDETGQRYLVEIVEIIPNEQTKAGHVNLTVKFRIIENMLTSESQDFTYVGSVEGTAPVGKDTGIYRGRAKIYRGRARITRKKTT